MEKYRYMMMLKKSKTYYQLVTLQIADRENNYLL